MSGRPGIICGMKAEARLVSADLPIGVAGGNQRRAERLAREFASRNVSLVISFGIAGGIDPALRPGDLVVASEIVSEAGVRLETDLDSRLRLLEYLPDAHEGAILSLEHPIASVEDKARWFAATHALACDMESMGAAQGAAIAGLPFMAVRAIADPASRSLPGAALQGMAEDGGIRPFAVLAALAKKPGDLPGLIGVARDTRAAMAALQKVSALFSRFSRG